MTTHPLNQHMAPMMIAVSTIRFIALSPICVAMQKAVASVLLLTNDDAPIQQDHCHYDSGDKY